MVSKDLGTVANNGKYYSPKYWVMKWKDKDDVVIETASKSLLDCQEKSDKLFTENVVTHGVGNIGVTSASDLLKMN